MTTKQRILQTALQLFNQYGVDTVTVRHIAKELGMSHGNLCYHFPNTDAIAETLYEQLIEELNNVIEEPSVFNTINLQAFYTLAAFVFEKLYKYRFLIQDFISLTRRNPRLKQKHRDLVASRRVFFRMGMEAGIQAGFLKPDIIKGQYENFFNQLFIIGDFWLASAEILFEGKEEDKLPTYLNIAFTLIVPYLTEKGLNEYKGLLNKTESVS
ncbi:TetR/AcrR family transcriptional regulator [Emticicia agri]|uniref:TetR/AcrR family transcriptional regulator n=1 Tax=Emticicia agri TaxID=2492393 RepID=A0A4Q5M024_9BACT|nr:TetR/AcrR family transcriptional regulator [Emticicia agri]RYU95177.1 TetR/AcrR family transcriptional regulator [Emticicia agri]